ncbi:type II toxin-antitoxin system VapB family antitoxin [Vreelandella arcis]|uniref:Antitoxin VapB n=1 Tax=Vreelandella arcis TaxID=416873 RepID=A0A1G9XPA7_9GAMM|nr:type II toxin-antitoxin system VapB family antitoxin [Halomonas arcis]SDM98679.1 antitoxin VapB [Halomonas arcis]
MTTVSIFIYGKQQAICLPSEMAYEGIQALEISRVGYTITLRPARPAWSSFPELAKADADFLRDRPSVVDDQRSGSQK